MTIYVWGFFVALGIMLSLAVSTRFAKTRGLDHTLLWNTAAWGIGAVLIGARLFHVLFYDFFTYFSDPLAIIRLWDGGMSMFGGIAGGAIVIAYILKRRGVSIIQYSDAYVFGLPLGIFIGRIGCFLIHDHPGTLTNFFLGIKYQDGVIRHDLGLYESLFGLLLFALFLLIGLRLRIKPGIFTALFLVLYGLFRVLLDYLRILDVTYLGLTPAQYFGYSIIILGGLMFWQILNKKASKSN